MVIRLHMLFGPVYISCMKQMLGNNELGRLDRPEQISGQIPGMSCVRVYEREREHLTYLTESLYIEN